MVWNETVVLETVSAGFGASHEAFQFLGVRRGNPRCGFDGFLEAFKSSIIHSSSRTSRDNVAKSYQGFDVVSGMLENIVRGLPFAGLAKDDRALLIEIIRHVEMMLQRW